MQRIIVISTIGLVLLGTSIATGSAHAALHTDGVNACLRAHGWSHGQRTLQRAELRVGRPNGLIRICGGTERPAAQTSGSVRHPVGAEAHVAPGYDHGARQIALHRGRTVISMDIHGTQARYDAQVSGLGVFGQATPTSPGGSRLVQVSTKTAGASRSFDWADAAIGAGFAMLVMVVAAVAATMIRHRGGVAMP